MIKKISSSLIKLGQTANLPLFFEDGKNIFLGKGKIVRQYHLDAIKRFNIEYFIFKTQKGKLIDNSDFTETDDHIF